MDPPLTGRALPVARPPDAGAAAGVGADFGAPATGVRALDGDTLRAVVEDGTGFDFDAILRTAMLRIL